MSEKKEAEKAEKRSRRLAAAVARIDARALELYPDEGTPTHRKKAGVRRQAFKQGALFWRYAQAVHDAEGQRMKHEQSERDRAANHLNRSEGASDA